MAVRMLPKLRTWNKRRPKTPDEQHFYSSALWTLTSRRQRQREPLCRLCAAEDRVVVATLVDHITPIQRGGARYDPQNLQSLCHSCHQQKSAREHQTGGRVFAPWGGSNEKESIA